MDDYILKILKANSVAKDQVKETLDSHEEDVKALESKKNQIDQKLAEYLAEETAKIQEEQSNFQAFIKPKYDQEYIERVNDLTNRFNDAKQEWYSGLLEGIISIDGK